MNNIYVDELPYNCEKCPCYSYSEGFCNCECWYQKYGVIKDVAEYTHLGLKEKERPADCPLKPLTDRLAEERKKVVQEIRDLAGNYFEMPYCDACGNTDYNDVVLTGNDLTEILDDVERSE